MITLDQIADVIAKRAQSGNGLDAANAKELLRPMINEMRTNLDACAKTMLALSKPEGDWRLSLGDGMTAIVNFSNAPSLRHLRAFVKVFTAMAEAYVEDPGASTTPDPGGE